MIILPGFAWQDTFATNVQFSPYIIPLVLATLVASVSAYLIWQRRGAPGAAVFAFVFLGEAFWAFLNSLQWASTNYDLQYSFFRLRFFPTEFLPIVFLVFAVQYSRRIGQFKRNNILYILIIPALNLIALWTNELHHLFVTSVPAVSLGNFTALAPQFGPWFWVHTAYDYAVLSAGILVLLFSLVNSATLYRGQILAVLGVTFLPLASNALYIFNASPFPYFDLTPIGFIIGGVPLAVGLYFFRALDVVPAAREAVIESMDEGVIVLDLRDRFVDLNPTAERIIGHTAAEAIGQPVLTVLDSFPVTKFHSTKDFQTEMTIKVGGQDRLYELRISELRDHSQVTGYLALLYDLTERKKAENELRQSQQTTKTILESIGDAYFEADTKGTLMYVNQSFCDAIGYSAEEIIGRNFRHYTEPQSVGRTTQIFSSVFQTGLTHHGMEYIFKRRDNRRGYAEATISLIRDEEGKPSGFRGIMRDVTDRRLAQEAIQKAKDAAEHELEIGRQIQAGFLPDDLPKLEGWEIAAFFRPAREVAGDFYDAFTLSNGKRVGVVVADVCDKGVGAALFMALFRSLFRALADQHYSSNLIDLLTDATTSADAKAGSSRGRRAMLSTGANALKSAITLTNNYIATVHGKSNMFATVFFGVLDPASGELIYINAGHEEPVVVGTTGIKARLGPTGPAVGMMPNMDFRIDSIVLDKGDFLLAFTDGVTDARNPAGQSFGEERLMELAKYQAASAADFLNRLEVSIRDHIGEANQFDDITLLALRHVPVTPIDWAAKDGLSISLSTNILKVEPRLENLPRCHEFVEEVVRRAGGDDDAVYAFKLGVDEAFTNLVSHSSPNGEVGVVGISASDDADNIVITINDHGKAFSPDDAPLPKLSADWRERPLGGLGIYLTKRLLDNVKYESDAVKGNTLMLIKRKRPNQDGRKIV